MVNETELLIEMVAIGLLWLFTLLASALIYIKHIGDKSYIAVRAIAILSSIVISLLSTIFEITWLCMYLGLPV